MSDEAAADKGQASVPGEGPRGVRASGERMGRAHGRVETFTCETALKLRLRQGHLQG